MICEYGCGVEAKYPPRKGRKRWCCEDDFKKCFGFIKKCNDKKRGRSWNEYMTEHEINNRKRNLSSRMKLNNPMVYMTPWNKGKIGVYSEDTLKIMREKRQGSRKRINIIKKKFPLFSKIEEMRYNTNNPGEKEIQIHCKNHNCKNSKEKGGWFTPTNNQFYERISQIEKENGTFGSYFYCSQKCKDKCPLYHSKGRDPFKDISKSYTDAEYQIFRQYVLERDSYKCQYCGEKATAVHHERPQKLEPFFALDPYFAWSCCEKCHYEKGHQNECSTNSLASTLCI